MFFQSVAVNNEDGNKMRLFFFRLPSIGLIHIVLADHPECTMIECGVTLFFWQMKLGFATNKKLP